MRSAIYFVAALISSALAIQVTYPGERDNWTTGGPNLVEWDSVETDPTSFKLVLITRDLKTTELSASVSTSTGHFVVNPPAGGFPAGTNYRVNFLSTSGSSQAILAQSPEFDIIAGAGTISAVSSTSAGSTPTTMTGSVSSTPRPTSTGTVQGPAGTGVTTIEAGPQQTGGASSSYKTSGALLGLVSVLYAFVL